MMSAPDANLSPSPASRIRNIALAACCAAVLAVTVPTAASASATDASAPKAQASSEASAHVADPANDFQAELTIVLEGALAPNYRGGSAGGRPLSIHLTREAGQWTEAWGKALNFNNALHEVTVTRSHITATHIELELDVNVRSDLWIRGGSARYKVKVERQDPGDGRLLTRHPLLRTANARQILRGQYEGQFEGQHATFAAGGDAVGAAWPKRAAHANYTLRETLPRPRLLFRAADVPAVRQRADTPLGRAVIERLKASDTAVGHAILYQLTGEQSHADRAGQLAQREMTDGRRHEEHETHQSTYWADRAHRVAYALDLCYGAWDQSLRDQAIAFLEPISHSGLYTPHQWGSGAIISPGSSQSDKMYAGCGISAMVVWGKTIDPPSPPAAGGALGSLQDRFGAADGTDREERMERYRQELERWRAMGGADRKFLDDARYARRMVLAGAMTAVGEGGTGGHPYTYDFALAWRHMFGRAVSSRSDLSYAGVKHLLSTIWVPDDSGRLQPRQPFGGDTLTGEELARLVAVADPQYQPGVLWYWFNLAGIQATDLGTDRGARQLIQTIALDDPLAMFYALMYMPEDPRPIDPARIVPRIWMAETPGNLWARNDFDGADSILARLTVRQRGSSSPTRHDHGRGPRTGHFDIYGLGHLWAYHTPANLIARQQYSIVDFTDMHTNGWGRGQMTWFAPDPDAPAASLTLDASRAYHHLERKPITRTVTEQRGNLTIERPVTSLQNVINSLGIEATRAFAVDYSGKAGVPGLFALVDQVTGDQQKMWTMHVHDLANTEVKIDGNTFTIHKGDATLRGTFITPAKVTIRKQVRYTSEVFFVRFKDYGIEPFRRDILTATAEDPTDGNFFLVMTLQRGDAPPVRVDGNGLNATVTIGEQTIRYDGQRILMGQ